MNTYQQLFIFIASCILLGWGVWGLLKQEILVGSRSYTGGTFLITKHQEPLRFYFWCALFILFGIGGFLALAFI